MKKLTFVQPHHLGKLHGELAARFPEWVEVRDGRSLARHALMDRGDQIELYVPDDADEAAIAAVVAAHDPTPAPPKKTALDELEEAVDKAGNFGQLKAALLSYARAKKAGR